MAMATQTVCNRIRVVLVEDHDLLRKGVRTALAEEPDIDVVGEADEFNKAVNLIAELQPGLVILDIKLRNGTGMDVVRQIKTLAPNSRILVLSAYNDKRYLFAFARLGVSGYLLKTVSIDDLKKAIHQVVQGAAIFGPEVGDNIVSLLQERADPPRLFESNHDINSSSDDVKLHQSLTPRQKEVLGCLSQGLRNCEIASALAISLKTVEAHVEQILLKLRSRSRTEAVLSALQNGY